VARLLAGAAMPMANFRYELHPEIFALLLLWCLLQVLTRCRERRAARVLWGWAPIAVVWATCHGSFVLGPIVASIFALGQAFSAARGPGHCARERWRRGARAGAPCALAALAMAACSLLNPLGLELARFTRDQSVLSHVRMLSDAPLLDRFTRGFDVHDMLLWRDFACRSS
jgi:hypothetical protein